jgi:putative DNA primase/helicase
VEFEQITKENIMHEDVFEYLMGIENEIELEIRYQELVNRSKEWGKKTEFEKMYKAYVRVKKRKEKEARKKEALERAAKREEVDSESMTDFDHDDYDDLYCGAWECNDKGVRISSDRGVNIACYHPIMPVKRLVNIQTGKEKMVVAFKRDHKWKEHTFDKSVLLSANKIVSFMTDYGILVTSETAKHLVKYFCEIESRNEETIIKQRSTSKMGWHKKEFIPFLDDENEIVFDAEDSFKGLYNSIKEHGDSKKYYSVIRKLLTGKRKEPILSILVSLSSVLVKPCGVLPFIFHLYGTGGKGKTISLMLGASVWGDPNEGGFMGDAKSTRTAFEMRLNFLNNLPLIIDDMSQVKQSVSQGRNNTDFSEFIYLVCSGRGNERSNVNLGLNQTTEWKNAILTNAEKPITCEISNGGEILRVIDYECEDGSIFEDAKEIADFIRGNYGFLGKKFIETIKKVDTESIKKIHKEYINIFKQMDKEGKKVDKQLIPMALILSVMKILEKMLDIEINISINELFDIIKTDEQMSDNERAYEFIMNEFHINKAKFMPNKGNTEEWGHLLDGFVLFNSNVFTEIARRGNFNKKMFINWAVQKGISQVNSKRTDKRVNRPNMGISGSFVFIKMKDYREQEEDDWEKVEEDANVINMFK